MDQVQQQAQRAEHLLAVGRLAEAADACREGLATSPGDAGLHLLLARVHLRADDPTEALAEARRCMDARVTVGAMHVAAIAHRLLGEFDQALDLFDRAIEQRPESGDLHAGRALTLVGPSLGWAGSDGVRDEVALRDARRSAAVAAEIAPQAGLPHYALGLAAVAVDDLPGAAAHLADALEREPEWPEAHLLLGNVRARQGMSRLASRHFAAAGHLDPTSSRPIESLRRLTASPRATVGTFVPLALFLGVVAAQAGPGVALATFLVVLPVGLLLAGFVLARAPQGPSPVRVVPEAERILAVDRRLGGGHDEPEDR